MVFFEIKCFVNFILTKINIYNFNLNFCFLCKMYKNINIEFVNTSRIFDNLLNISEKYNSFCFFDSNNYSQDKYSRYKKLLAFGVIDDISFNRAANERIENVTNFLNNNSENWKFLYLNYKLKNSFEKLTSNNIDLLNFHDIYIFIPKFVVIETKDSLVLQCHSSIENKEINEIIDNIKCEINPQKEISKTKIKLKPRINKAEYISCIDKIRDHIKLGDIYEMNFCQEFHTLTHKFDLINTYKKLKAYSPAPFSAYFKEGKRHLISASPERYIQKRGNMLISQPIKGTAPRNSSVKLDNKLKQDLIANDKERAENIMIVDLVRNDLSRIEGAEKVEVAELCRIYSFAHVHQMISTVKAKIKIDTSFMEIIKSSFPMGSMTGAPKIKAMELIDEYESQERGLFSGSVGYIDTKGDFDLNVIIRSLLYNQNNNYLSLSTGGAITYKSNAEDEYQESLLKANAILKL